MHTSARNSATQDTIQKFDTHRFLELDKELITSTPNHTTQDNIIAYNSFSSPRNICGDIGINVEASKDCNIKVQTFMNDLYTLGYPRHIIKMNDLAQNNSMSPTQKNPVTAYAHLFSGKSLDHLQYTLKPNCNSLELTCNHQTQDLNSPFQHASSQKSESPTSSSHGNEIYCVKSDTESQNVQFAGEESLVPDKLHKFSQPELAIENLQHFEPQTPALHANPFKSKGSIMQKAELFAATQPSSINKWLSSPTSSRPSPEVYDEFSSPVKRRKLTTSTLTTYKNETKEKTFSRNLFSNSFSEEDQTPLTDVSSVQSLDSVPRITKSSSSYKLHPFTSLKEGLKRRSSKCELSLLENSDSSPRSPPNIRQHKKELRVQEQSPVSEFHNPQVCNNLELIESCIISKTLTKHSQVNYDEADSQCKEFNSQDNRVKDYDYDSHSQSHHNSNENFYWDKVSADIGEAVNLADKESLDNGISVHEIENQDPAPLLCSIENSENQLPKLNPEPKQDLASRRKISRTRSPQEVLQNISSRMIAKKGYLHSDHSEKVPETSPIIHQLPLVDESAMISSQGNVETIIEKLPTPTPDPNYENAVRINYSGHQKKVVLKKKKPVSAPILCQNTSALQVLNSPKIMNRNKIDEPIVSTLPSDNMKIRTKIDRHSKILLQLNSPRNTYTIDRSKSAQKSKNPLNPNERKSPIILIQGGINASTYSASFDKSSNLEDMSSEVQPSTNTLNRDREGKLSGSFICKSTRKARVEVAVACLRTPPIMKPDQSTLNSPSNLSSPFSNVNFQANRRPIISRNISKLYQKKTVTSASGKRITKRKPPESKLARISQSTRSSKRQSLAQAIKEDSDDPLTAQSPEFSNCHSGLFESMAFAVSFVKNDKERKNVISLISENGGLLLEDGFDSLFEPFPHANPSLFDSGELSLSNLGKSLKFVSVIADDYSRKTKYIQALALGLPCISGRWIQCCIIKNSVLDWSPYLLCAGQSSVLGNACRSRILQPYSAAEAELSYTFAARNKIFEGKSVLLVMGKGKAQQKRKTFNFLARALGPARIGNVTDIFEARKVLAEAQAQGLEWDLLHVHDYEKNIESDVFGVCGKQKSIDHEPWPDLKRVRIITDEIIIQSLIFGELIE